MTVVAIGMLVSLGTAVAVLALVAVPRVREGERILTPDGEAAVREARARARALAVEAREQARTRRAGPRDRGGALRGAATGVRARAGSVRDTTVSAGRQAATVGAAAITRARAATRAGSTAVVTRSATAVADPPPVPAAEDDVIDLRDRAPGPDREPPALARARLARRLEWGEPEPGPRHRR